MQMVAMITWLARDLFRPCCCHSCRMYVLVQKHCKAIEVLTYNAVPSLIAALFLFAVSAMVKNVNVESFTWFNLAGCSRLVASVGGIVVTSKLGLGFDTFPSVDLLSSSSCCSNILVAMSMVRFYLNSSAYDDPSALWHLLTKAPISYPSNCAFAKNGKQQLSFSLADIVNSPQKLAMSLGVLLLENGFTAMLIYIPFPLPPACFPPLSRLTKY